MYKYSMLRRSLLQLAWNILATIICFIVMLIVIGILFVALEAIGIPAEFLGTDVGASLAFGIPPAILYALVGSAFYGLSDYHNKAKDKPNEWSDRMKSNNPLYYTSALKQCIPYLVISLIIVVLRIAFWKQLNNAIRESLSKSNGSTSMPNMIVLGLLSIYVCITLVSIIRLPVTYSLNACPGCGNMGSFEFAHEYGYEVYTRTTDKVDADTGYVLESHQTVTTTPKCKCRCHFCGHMKVMTDRHRKISTEKK